jgi:hypothetical protein
MMTADTLPVSIRHQCHLVLQAVAQGAEIIALYGRNGYMLINGQRCPLLQEWTVNLLCSERFGLLTGSLVKREDQARWMEIPLDRDSYWQITITTLGLATLAQWEAETWGETTCGTALPWDQMADA